MRVFRDTRFSRDKRPYKTNIGIQFRHALARDVHAPGFYLHVSPAENFLGVGCWRPAPVALGRIREWIAERPERWFAARDDARFNAVWTLEGERLSRPPRGYAADHPALDDLKRKDFIGIVRLATAEIVAPSLVERSAACFAAATPLMAFLCEAVGASW